MRFEPSINLLRQKVSVFCSQIIRENSDSYSGPGLSRVWAFHLSAYTFHGTAHTSYVNTPTPRTIHALSDGFSPIRWPVGPRC